MLKKLKKSLILNRLEKVVAKLPFLILLKYKKNLLINLVNKSIFQDLYFINEVIKVNNLVIKFPVNLKYINSYSEILKLDWNNISVLIMLKIYNHFFKTPSTLFFRYLQNKILYLFLIEFCTIQFNCFYSKNIKLDCI